MSPLESLAPDQRAVVALILQQGRSYDEIATLLGIPVDAVRARARAGLTALAPDSGLPAEVTAPLADYLLAQQSAADAEATRGLLAESAPARGWATGVAERLADVARGSLPEIPGAAADPAAARDTAADRAPATHDTAADRAPTTPDTAAESLDEPPSRAGEAPAVRAEAASRPGEAPAARAADAPAPRPRPVRDTPAAATDTPPPASSKLGGMLLIAAVIAIVGVVLFLVLRSGDDPAGEEVSASPTPTATATATPEAQVTDQITLRPPNGGKAKGTMTVYLQGEQLLFALQGQNLPPSSEQAAYAVWLTGPGEKARRLGFTNPVGEDGALGIQGPSEKDLQAFPQLYATFEKVVVSQERTEDSKRPTNVVLAGRLPAGR